MKTRTWKITVIDGRGKRHRGTCSWGDDVARAGPVPPAEFHVALRVSPDSIDVAPPRTAVCIPRLARESASLGPAETPLPDALEFRILRSEMMLPAVHHAQYRAGSIITPGGRVDPVLVFAPPNRVDFERLALMLVEQAQAEELAPCTAVIRHELHLPPGADAIAALRAALQPADAASKPPARAPAVVRLRKVLKALEAGAAPQATLEELTEDLRFLQLFEAPGKAMQREALDRLLGDIVSFAPETKRPAERRRRKPAPIVRFPRREDA